MESIKKKVVEIIEQIANLDMDLMEYFTNQDDMSGMGLSSLEYIQLIVFLEEDFGIEFGDDVFQEEYFKDINKIVEYIKVHI